jgi:lysophospholipase L1-like esterase
MKRITPIATRPGVTAATRLPQLFGSTAHRMQAGLALLGAVVGCGHLDHSQERPSSRPVATASNRGKQNAVAVATTAGTRPASSAAVIATTAGTRPASSAAVIATTAGTHPASSAAVIATRPASRTVVAATALTHSHSPAPPPCRLLAIGDSLTDPKSHGGGYLRAIERDCNCTVNNLGRGGDMVNQMRKRLLAHLAQSPPSYSHVLVFGGVNDLYSDETAKRTVAKIEGDLEAMYRTARNHGARVIAVTVAPWGGFRRYFSPHRAETTLELNRWIADGPKRGRSDYWVDAYSRLSCGVPTELCARYAAPHRDGLHFGPIGHERLGQALVEALGPTQCPGHPDAGSASRAEGGPPEDVQ